MARKPKGGDDMEMQNAAKTLMANIRFMSVDNPIRSLVFTSSIPNEGKSTVTCNVARAIASSGMRVCLVECDMRNRTLAGMLGVRSTGGLYSVLSDTMPLQQAIVSTNTENMFLLDAEPHIPNPADILASKRFAALAHKLEQMFDYVIFDTPPVGMLVDAAVVSTIVDAAVLVVRELHEAPGRAAGLRPAEEGRRQRGGRRHELLQRREVRVLLCLLQPAGQAREGLLFRGEGRFPQPRPQRPARRR